MKTTTTTDSPHPWAALLGFDWGDSRHAVALRWENQPEELLELEHSAENLHRWLDQLEQRCGGRPVAVAIEASRGAAVYAMLERPWIHVFPVHPATSSHQRRAFRPSGAKDDVPDARLLLSLLEHHRERLRPLVPQDPATRALQGLVQARRKVVDRRTQLTNQLTSLLKDYFPQALGWCGCSLAAPLALDFLDRWPRLVDLQAARPPTLRRFYYTHNVRRPELVEERLQQIQAARPLTADPAIQDVHVRMVRWLVAELRVLRKHLADFEEAIAQAFAAHPEHALFRALPGAGPQLAPRLLVALGPDRTRYPSAPELQRLIGVAPVTERSGGRTWIHWRWNAPAFLRQTFLEWAAQTVVYSAWAKAYYEQQKARGHRHWSILRALAFKWLRIVWKCWQNQEIYDEQRYLAQLTARRSPLAARAREIAQEMARSS